jgi:uracil-DNA glycosylase
VLLLNACLTVPAGQANGHAGQVWEPFTDAVIKVLNQKDTPVVFILWGGYARKKKSLVTNPKHAIIESAHPSPLSAYRGFFGSKPFSKANAYLVSQGQSPIDWLK